MPHRTTSRRSRSQVPDDARVGPKNDEGELESATAPFQVANLDQNAISSTTSCRQTEHSSERLSPSGGRDRANPLPTTMPQAITAYVTWTLRSRVTLRVFSIRVLARPLGYPPSNSHSPPAPPTKVGAFAHCVYRRRTPCAGIGRKASNTSRYTSPLEVHLDFVRPCLNTGSSTSSNRCMRTWPA